MDVGEAEVAALEAEGEAGVVETEEVQERGVQVVDVHAVFDRVEAEVVGGAERQARLDPVAGHPVGGAELKGTGVVVMTPVPFKWLDLGLVRMVKNPGYKA